MRAQNTSASATISQVTKANAPQRRTIPALLALLALLVGLFGYNYKGSNEYLARRGIDIYKISTAVSYIVPKVYRGLNDTNEYCPDGKR